jgi:hypothetical protein
MSEHKNEVTDDQITEGVEQVKAHLAARSGTAPRGAAGAPVSCDCPDHVIEAAVRAAAAAPVGKIDFSKILQIVMSILAAIGPLLPKKPGEA